MKSNNLKLNITSYQQLENKMVFIYIKGIKGKITSEMEQTGPMHNETDNWALHVLLVLLNCSFPSLSVLYS